MRYFFAFSFIFLLFLSPTIQAQNELKKDQQNIYTQVGFIINYSEKEGKDSLFFASLELLYQDLIKYKNLYGFDDFYSENSIFYAREIVTKNPKLSFQIYEQNIDDAINLKIDRPLFFNYHEMGNLYFSFKDVDKATEFYLKAANVKQQEREWTEYAWTMVDIGNLYFYSKQFDVSMFYYNKAKEVFIKHEKGEGLDYFYALYYNNLGLIEIEKKNIEVALDFFRKAYSYRLNSKRVNLYPHSYLYFIRCFNFLEMTDSSEFYFNKAIEIQKSLKLHEELIDTYSEYARFFASSSKFKEAIRYFNSAKELAIKDGFNVKLTSIFFESAALYHNIGNADSMLNYLLLTDSLAVLYMQQDIEEAVLVALIQIFENKQDYEKTLKYYKRYTVLLESKSKNDAYKKEVQFQVEERKREEEMNTEIAERNSKIIFNQSLALALLLILIVISVVAGYRIRLQKKTLQRTIAHRDLIYSIIAHDLRGPLSGVFSAIDLIENNEIDNEETKMQIIKSSQSTLKNTFGLLENLLEWANYQSNKTAFSPKNHQISLVVESVMQLLDTQASKKSVHFELQIPENHFGFFDKYMITAVLRNVLSNAIKFSMPNMPIIISSTIENKFLKISIQDFGIGIKPEILSKLKNTNESVTTLGTNREKGSGLGYQIIRDFLKRNKGFMKIESELNQGTTFIMYLPLNKSN